MKVIIRADGGDIIGMGHVMRMLVLADKLWSFAEVVFACRDGEEYRTGAGHIEACGYKVHRINGEGLADELAAIGGDCLITDSYAVDEDYFDSTKEVFRFTGYMDDVNRHYINADFIINQNIYAGDLTYRTNRDTKIFAGTRYVLLREEFAGLPRRVIRENIKDVMLTVGGADPGNISETLAQKLSKAFPAINFHIVIGPSFTNRSNLEKLAGGNIFLHDNPRMSELMLKCDAAISACGSTIYELCACGTPTIGLVTADNQIMASRKLNFTGVIKLAGDLDEVARRLDSLTYEARAAMSQRGQSLVDGQGSTRLAEGIRGIIYG